MTETGTTSKPEVALRSSRYASNAMADRRARILETAREMLVADDGKFTMRDLARQSGVALATLYNIFDSQDELVAQAVVEIFVERIENLVPKDGGPVLERIERAQELSNAEILRVPAYAKKMLTIYFSEDTTSRIRDVLHGQAAAGNVRYLQDLKDEGALLPWVNIDLLASDAAVAVYAIITRWAVGEIRDDQLLARQKFLRLSLLAGFVTDDVQVKIKKRLQNLSKEIGAVS